MPTEKTLSSISKHYGSEGLTEKIISALRRSGKDPDALEVKDLSVIDQLHTGGHKATIKLANTAKIAPGANVLDAGCGIGGSSRLLAKEFGCKVIGIDLTEAFCAVAERLTKGTGLSKEIFFKQGDALRMPFKEGEFDVVWCQHTTMNIPDKEGLFLEFKRVLGPEGKLVLHEITENSGKPIHVPVPWANDHSISFLIRPEKMGAILTEAGFLLQHWSDVTADAIAWWDMVDNALKARKTRPLGPHIIFGEAAGHFGANMSRNLKENRIKVIEAVYTKGRAGELYENPLS